MERIPDKAESQEPIFSRADKAEGISMLLAGFGAGIWLGTGAGLMVFGLLWFVSVMVYRAKSGEF